VTAGDVKIVRVLLLLLLLLKTHMELLSDYSRGRFPAIDNAEPAPNSEFFTSRAQTEARAFGNQVYAPFTITRN